jgi:hypothetical protein
MFVWDICVNVNNPAFTVAYVLQGSALLESYKKYILKEPYQINADPDPSFHCNADPDPTFILKGDSDPDAASS